MTEEERNMMVRELRAKGMRNDPAFSMNAAEQKLSDSLHTKLGVKPSGEVLPYTETNIGNGLWAKEEDGEIRIASYGDKKFSVWLDPEAFRNLEAFAQKIGWTV